MISGQKFNAFFILERRDNLNMIFRFLSTLQICKQNKLKTKTIILIC